MLTLEILKPDDWHVHFRDGDYLSTTVPASARCFGRAIAMPNLNPPVLDIKTAETYYHRIKKNIPLGVQFTPYVTLYLTPSTTPSLMQQASEVDFIKGVKLYPAGATTLSEFGVRSIKEKYAVFEAMEKYAIPLLIHGEVTDASTDIFDREKIFIEKELIPLRQTFPKLRIVLEHITTEEAVQYISEASAPIAATITVHHLLYHRNHLLSGGIFPHLYCLPILKREHHQKALRKAATSGNPKFFLGTDSAPHSQNRKECASGCAGIFSAPNAIELYAQVFEEENALDKLQGFASQYGADFYELPHPQETIILQKKSWKMPDKYPFGDGFVIPLAAQEDILWQLK